MWKLKKIFHRHDWIVLSKQLIETGPGYDRFEIKKGCKKCQKIKTVKQKVKWQQQRKNT